jgi:F-type H+-transporting ATPase subunit a
VYIPQPLATIVSTDDHGHRIYEAVWDSNTGIDLIDRIIEPLEFKFTKFMILEVVVAIVLCLLFTGLAGRMRGGGRPEGRLWNLFEAILLYFRDFVARPAIGSHDADRFVPLIWTTFFFVLGCNLMGLIPWMGSPTGALAATAALALTVFVTVIATGMLRIGVVGFWKAQVPHMDLPGPVAFLLVPMIFLIEIGGLLIKHFVLAVRLLANMIGGHVVLAVLMAFIAATSGVLWYGVMPASVLGAAALSLLELLVAFLQAYIFAFLTALFIGMAVHPH